MEAKQAMGSSGAGEDLYHIAILIDQLKHEDVSFRVNASTNLARIAQALGPERTRGELIPFLCGKFRYSQITLFT